MMRDGATRDTPGGGAQQSMSCYMTCKPADDGPLDAASGFRSSRSCKQSAGA